MKNNSTKWLVIILLSMAGCKKDVQNSQLQQDLVGNWELSRTYSFGGTINFAPGNGNTIQFSSNGQYMQAFNNSDTAYSITSTFYVQKENNCAINLIMNVVANGTYYSHANVSGDTLYMNAGNCIVDGASLVYLRK